MPCIGIELPIIALAPLMLFLAACSSIIIIIIIITDLLWRRSTGAQQRTIMVHCALMSPSSINASLNLEWLTANKVNYSLPK